ncbi:unnamed protein product [Cylicocyclus nassatus]|uniref:Uncharacterized protein n=1 Tax=Cylicocyclus nassatus TaxID=53992 RepID=A0AA36M3P4_CYLNA|nr:unnamed protein product [Cylicocyclus nassatus]
MRSRWITKATIKRFKPYWKVFIVIAVLTVFLAAVIVIENIFFLSTALNQNPLLLFLPYPLSWILIVAACIFGRLAFVLHATDSKNGAVHHISPSLWSGDSRPSTANSVFYSTQSLTHEPLSVSYNSQVFLPHGTNYAPQSPFSIEEAVSRKH